jgi:hypothetical protein
MEDAQSFVFSMGHILCVLVRMAKSQLLALVKVRDTLMTTFGLYSGHMLKYF